MFIFHNFGNLLGPLELVPASRERVFPTEWQVRTVLGDCITKAKVISIQAPQYRQYSLINDFLDHANLSIREAAAPATNWIKDRPEGLKLQNLALATMTGPAVRSFPNKYDCRRPVRPQQLRVIGLRETLDPSRESTGDCKGFFSAYGSPSKVICCRICTSSAVGFSRAPSEANLASLLPAVNPLLGCSSGKNRSRPIGVRVCLVAQFNFSLPHLIRVSGQRLCSGRKIRDVSSS